jgi:hypothetical protein
MPPKRHESHIRATELDSLPHLASSPAASSPERRVKSDSFFGNLPAMRAAAGRGGDRHYSTVIPPIMPSQS